MEKYLLIFTDGYTINTYEHDSRESAIKAMDEDYNERELNEYGNPSQVEYDVDDIHNDSYNDHESDASLFTGSNVYVWKIVKISL